MTKIAITAALTRNAQDRKSSLIAKYNFIDLEQVKNKHDSIDKIIVLGGDGTMLHLLHQFEKNPIAFYGINCGTIGFLMNEYSEENLLQIIENAKPSYIHPLRMMAKTIDGKQYNHIAINEVSLLRQTSQAAKINIQINDRERMKCLTADGVLVATAAGSTAYNLSLRGPIIPFGVNILALTPISPFRPRDWHGAILPSENIIEFNVLDSANRSVSATADYNEVRNVQYVKIYQDTSLKFTLLFNSKHCLEERIAREQFRND